MYNETVMSKRSKKAFENFKTYQKNCIEFGNRNVFTDTVWEYEVFKRQLPIQKDSCNCALYVMYYMDVVGCNKEFDMGFDPREYRIFVG